MRLPQDVEKRLRCPACRARLVRDGDQLRCGAQSCGKGFPLIDGVPVLLDESRSVFAIADFVGGRDTTFVLQPTRWERTLQRMLGMLPEISRPVGVRRNYQLLRDQLLSQTAAPRVLVVGGSILGQGLEQIAADARIELVASDVSFGPETAVICDAHDLPFEDETFDAAIVQAVLEHVVDPARCVEEVYRVLKPSGLVYSETPFIQQVHMGRYDFTRYTHSGHRRLFRHFGEVDSGLVCGPGMALAWSFEYFLLSFARSRPLRGALRAFARATAFPLKYFDPFLVRRSGAYDAASGFYFLGRKEVGRAPLSDRELLRYYKGAITN